MYNSRAEVKLNDILFIRVGVGCIGRVAIVDCKKAIGIATDYIYIIRVKKINPYFLTLYLKTKFSRDIINSLKHGVGTLSINKVDLLSIPIPKVAIKKQRDIEKKYKAILIKWRHTISYNLDTSIYEKKMEELLSSIEEMLYMSVNQS